MIEFGSFIYLDVYRTGSKHVIHVLRTITDEPEVRLIRHASVTARGVRPFARHKLTFATVRNPWDWYVSLWSYGAGGKSAIRRYMAEKLPPDEVDRFYDRRDSAPAFRRWLAAIHDPEFAARVLHEHYPQSALAPFMGFYTYRFLRVTTRFPRFFLRRWGISGPSAIRPFHLRRKAYDLVLRNETLTDDLVRLVTEHERTCRFKPGAADAVRAADAKRLNASARALPDYRDYYDDEARALVEKRDSFFGEEFGYRF